MSRESRDATYGRQGGRVVPFDPPVFVVGELVALDLGEWHPPTVPVVVIDVLDHGRELLLRFPSGGTLYVNSRSPSLSRYRK